MSNWNTPYALKLKDPRWKAFRDTVVARDKNRCTRCHCCEELEVHHLYYQPTKEPWEYPLNALTTLCEVCHKRESMYRTGNEAALLNLLRARGYSFADLARLESAILTVHEKHPGAYTPDEVARVIGFVLETPSVMAEIARRCPSIGTLAVDQPPHEYDEYAEDEE